MEQEHLHLVFQLLDLRLQLGDVLVEQFFFLHFVIAFLLIFNFQVLICLFEVLVVEIQFKVLLLLFLEFFIELIELFVELGDFEVFSLQFVDVFFEFGLVGAVFLDLIVFLGDGFLEV